MSIQDYTNFRNKMKYTPSNPIIKVTTPNINFTASKSARQNFNRNNDKIRNYLIAALIMATITITSIGTYIYDATKVPPSTFNSDNSFAEYLGTLDKDKTCLDEAIEKYNIIDIATMENDFSRYSELITSEKLSKQDKSELLELQNKIASNYPEFVEALCLSSVKAKISDATGIDYRKIRTNVSQSQDDGYGTVAIYDDSNFPPLFSTGDNTLQSEELTTQIRNIADLQNSKKNGKYNAGNNPKKLSNLIVKTYNNFCMNFKGIKLYVDQTREEFKALIPGRLQTDSRSISRDDDGR